MRLFWLVYAYFAVRLLFNNLAEESAYHSVVAAVCVIVILCVQNLCWVVFSECSMLLIVSSAEYRIEIVITHCRLFPLIIAFVFFAEWPEPFWETKLPEHIGTKTTSVFLASEFC